MCTPPTERAADEPARSSSSTCATGGSEFPKFSGRTLWVGVVGATPDKRPTYSGCRSKHCDGGAKITIKGAAPNAELLVTRTALAGGLRASLVPGARRPVKPTSPK